MPFYIWNQARTTPLTGSGQFRRQFFKDKIEIAAHHDVRHQLETRRWALALHYESVESLLGQGTALVSVLDAFWDNKGYVTPAEFTRFTNSIVPLVRMSKCTWTSGETFNAQFDVANFGPASLGAADAEWTVVDTAGTRDAASRLPPVSVPTGALTPLCGIKVDLAKLSAPARYRLIARVADRENDWGFGVYPDRLSYATPSGIVVARRFDDALERRLDAGATVLLLPAKESVRGRFDQWFTSICWNAPWTEGGESETLGILTDDPKHAVFREFPPEFHSNWQWFELLAKARPATLDSWGVNNPWPKRYRPIIQLIDDWNQNRKLAVLAEGRVGAGRLMLCTLDIETELQRRVVARQFRKSLLDYMASPDFQPAAQLTAAQIRGVLE
jgi:hypothetical protein